MSTHTHTLEHTQTEAALYTFRGHKQTGFMYPPMWVWI